MTRWLIVAFALFASTAHGKDVTVVRDEWVSRWSGSQKVGWVHRKIEERPASSSGDARFLLTIATTTMVDTDQLLVTEYRVETDELARVRTATHVQRGPWGTSTQSIAAIGSALVWRWQVRELPLLEGKIEAELHEPRVLALLVQRGVAPAGARDTMVLRSAPAPGARRVRLDVTNEPDGSWRVSQDEWIERRTADGHLLTIDGSALREIPTTAERASTLDEGPPSPPGAALPAFVEIPGVRVRAPGTEWELVKVAEVSGAELGRVLLVHPSRAFGSIQVELGGLPGETPEDRLQLGRAYQERTNTEGAGRLELGSPELIVWRGRPAIRFAGRGRMGSGIELAGDWVLVDLGPTRAIVFMFQPIDLRATRAADLERIASAVDLTPVELAWKRVHGAGASIEVPTQWTASEPGQFESPAGGSNLLLRRGPLGGLSLKERQARLPRRDHRSELEVERREETWIDGRAAFVTVFRVTTRPGGFPMRARLVCCGTAYDDGTCTEVVLLASDNELDEAAVKRVLSGLRWVQEH